MTLQVIPPDDLIAFDDYTARYPIMVDLVYAKANHKDNMFKEAIYKPNAKMLGHRRLAQIVFEASLILNRRYHWTLAITDCLRPFEAQVKIQNTSICQQNPRWFQDPVRLFSPPGAGGHPRGLAVDLVPYDQAGFEIDMGTPFDFLPTDGADKDKNPSHREYVHMTTEVAENRARLTDAMMDAAKLCGERLRPLPQEWWDFRFFNEDYEIFAPIYDAQLPAHLQMMAHQK
jgi:D-alanyl-D-alanine dipeptidase